MRLKVTEKLRNKVDAWSKISRDLRSGTIVQDQDFDQVYPHSIRALSESHWTPVEVAIKAAKLLTYTSKMRILDVGSGCGKFCTIAALVSDADYVGIEQRSQLLLLAKKTARRLQASNVNFILGNMMELDWSAYNGFYLFNPFHENRLKLNKIDGTILLSHSKYHLYVRSVVSKLEQLKKGTRVVTYHGFGGKMPETYAKRSVSTEINELELWVKDD